MPSGIIIIDYLGVLNYIHLSQTRSMEVDGLRDHSNFTNIGVTSVAKKKTINLQH